MDQVFNELSLSASLPNNYAANDAFLALQKASEKLVTLGFSSNIRVTEDFRTRCITPECTIYEYLRNSTGGLQKTLRHFLLKRFTGAPYVEQLCSASGITDLEEYSLEGIHCKDLALASHFGIPALSLAGDSRFVPPFITLTYSSIEAEDAKICEEERQVGIICREEDVNHHVKSIKNIMTGTISSGEQLLNYARHWLQHLLFSSVAEEQLRSFLRGDSRLPRIHGILDELQRAMQEAIDNHAPFLPLGDYTPVESATAIHGKNKEKHTFRFLEPDASGNLAPLTLLCQAHMRINSGERVYFGADRNKGFVYIGHIGEHLPCKNF